METITENSYIEHPQELSSALTLGSFSTRAAAIDFLRADDKPVRVQSSEPNILVELLASSLSDDNSRIRQCAIESVRVLGMRAATPSILCKLAELCEDANPGVRHAAISAVGALGSLGATDRILKLLPDLLWDPVASVAQAATHTLSALGPAAGTPEILSLVTNMLWSKDATQCQAAVEALVSIVPTKLHQEAISRLTDLVVRDETLRDSAAKALVGLDPSTVFTIVNEISRKVCARNSDSALNLRIAALGCYVRGEYQAARLMLRALILAGFELPSTHCHLARLAILADDLRAMCDHVEKAWILRNDAQDYVLPRILWFKTAVLMLQSPEQSSAEVIGQFKTAYEPASEYDWTMRPVLEHITGRVSVEHHALLASMAGVLEDRETHLPRLMTMREWALASHRPLT